MKMPAKIPDTTQNIYTAICAAMAQVKRVAKDNRNVEQKYDFASIDDFMAMVGPICAANGIIIVIDEDSVEFIEKAGKYGPTSWVKIVYQITVCHISGEQLPTVRRHVEVIRSGPQAYGSAQSYVTKNFCRQLFLIPTGDGDDPDLGSVIPAQSIRQDDGESASFDLDVSQAIKDISGETTLDGLGELWANLSKSNRAVAMDARVSKAKDDRKKSLSTPVKNDLGGDEIPY